MDLVWGDRSTMPVGGVDVHVETAGPRVETGEIALAGLHGFVSGTFTWAGTAPIWAQRHPFVAWDRPPFGRSGRPRVRPRAEDPYAESAALRHAAAVLERHAPGARIVLVGHSAGTVVASALACARLVDVAGVVLIAPALDGAPPPVVRRLAGLPGAGRVGSTALWVALRGAGPAIRRVGRHRTPLLDATADESARTLRRPGTAEALWHLTATWTRPSPLDELEPLGVPTMVIGGCDDRISPSAATELVAERLGAVLHVLAGVGHAPHEQVPDAVAGLVTDFVESVA